MFLAWDTFTINTLSLNQLSQPQPTAATKSSVAVATVPAFPKSGAATATRTARMAAMSSPARGPSGCATTMPSSPVKSQVEAISITLNHVMEKVSIISFLGDGRYINNILNRLVFSLE